MLMSNQKFYRIMNGLNKNAWMLSETEVIPYLKGKGPHFVSTSYYTKQQAEEFKKTKSVAGMTDLKTNQLWFDFDSTNLEESRKEAVELHERLLKYFANNNTQLFFSANKGFHITVKLNDDLTSQQVKKIVLKLGTGLNTLDLKIYDANRILRASNTKHEKTGLYKIPLTSAEIASLTIDQIKELAKQPRELFGHDVKSANLPDVLLVEEEKISTKVLSVLNEEDPLRIKEIDFTNKPHGWKEYKWSIALGRFEVGTRNHAMMVVASTCRALKYGKEHTAAICSAADKLHCEITNDTEMDESAFEREVLDVVFGSHWNGGQYSFENDIQLRNYCNKYGFKTDKVESGAINLQDVNSSFKDYVKNIDKNTIKTGIKRLDDALPITIGNNLGIVGSASSGKTSIALEILKNTSMNGVVSVIASLDMHRNRLYEKVLYKVSHDLYKKSLTREELYKKFQEDEDSGLIEEVKKQFGNVYFYDRSRPTVSNLRQFILDVEAETGKKVKLLMIDYFERIGSDVSDATASSLKVANELQDLLNDLNLAVITLVQPNKFSLSGGPDTPILSYTAIKGSSFLYQSFRSIVSIWRPFFNAKTNHLDKFMEMAILKNDLGELAHFTFNWEGKTGSITEMSEEQEFQYKNNLEEKKNILTPEQEESFSNFRRK